jgi:hypothetical protein
LIRERTLLAIPTAVSCFFEHWKLSPEKGTSETGSDLLMENSAAS